MTILDANILIYAYNVGVIQHKPVRKWLDQLSESGALIGLSWVTIWAFLRVSTNPRIFSEPFELPEAFQIVRRWLELPNVAIPEPGPRHLELLGRLAIENQAGGTRMTDAALAALALEHGAVLASTDRDFSRFRDLRWVNPLDPGSH